jgi:hypothetical protein
MLREWTNGEELVHSYRIAANEHCVG